MLLVAMTVPLPWLVAVETWDRVFRDAEEAEVRVDWDIFEDLGPCPFILLG